MLFFPLVSSVHSEVQYLYKCLNTLNKEDVLIEIFEKNNHTCNLNVCYVADCLVFWTITLEFFNSEIWFRPCTFYLLCLAWRFASYLFYIFINIFYCVSILETRISFIVCQLGDWRFSRFNSALYAQWWFFDVLKCVYDEYVCLLSLNNTLAHGAIIKEHIHIQKHGLHFKYFSPYKIAAQFGFASERTGIGAYNALYTTKKHLFIKVNN